eukprot:3940681-Rhodomonas_salina.1
MLRQNWASVWADTIVCYVMPCQYRAWHSRGVGRYHHSTNRLCQSVRQTDRQTDRQTGRRLLVVRTPLLAVLRASCVAARTCGGVRVRAATDR